MIKKLYWHFIDEIKGVEDYIKCSMDTQDTDADLSKMFADMAANECSHAERLYKAAKRLDDKRQNPDIPHQRSDLVEMMGEQLMKARAFLSALDS